MKLFDPFETDFSGTHLIEASAGTGKTYSIASLYVRAIAEGRCTVDQILVVTYTEAATKELKDRLMNRLGEAIEAVAGEESIVDDLFLQDVVARFDPPGTALERLKKALHTFDEASIYTIHGFCQHALQEHAFSSGTPFHAELIPDDSDLIAEIVDDFWRTWVGEASENTNRLPLLKLMLDKGYSPDSLTAMMANYVSKPYLKVRPPVRSHATLDEELAALATSFHKMRYYWKESRDHIFALLNSGHLSYYRTSWLEGWMGAMDDLLQQPVPPIHTFDKISRFAQSHIDVSLKKKSISDGEQPPQHDFFKEVDRYIACCEALNDVDTRIKRALFEHLRSALPARKEARQVFSYDDLLTRLRDALMRSSAGDTLAAELRTSYPLALVDEFQDTDPVQYQIFQKVYAGSFEAALFMIGDPKQSIYNFRGADIFSYLQAKQDVSEDRTSSLNRNFRSTAGLIDGVNQLFSLHEQPFVIKGISYQPIKAGRPSLGGVTVNGSVEAPLEIRTMQLPDEEEPYAKGLTDTFAAHDTAAQIVDLLNASAEGNARIGEQEVEASDIAVLVRTHRQGQLISDALQQWGVKSVTHSPESVFHSEEAGHLYRLLQAVANPMDTALVTTALAGKLLNYSAADLYRLNEDGRAWAQKLWEFSEWHRMWQESGFAFMFRTLMQDEDMAETVVAKAGGERTLTNINHLSERIAKRESERGRGMHHTLKWLQRKRTARSSDAEEEQLRLESDENLVRIVTIHHSKGLEYGIVFCPFLWKAPRIQDKGRPLVYHEDQRPDEVYLDLNGKEDPDRTHKRRLQAREELAESIRLAYVAITRAKHRCVLQWANAKKSGHSPLGFLLLGAEQSLASLRSSVDSSFDDSGDVATLFRSALDALHAHSSITCVEVSSVPDEKKLVSGRDTFQHLGARAFFRTGRLSAGDDMSSFSSLVRMDHGEDDTVIAYADEPILHEEQDDSASLDIFGFPRGPNPGTAIHHIFENIDFADSTSWQKVIEAQLQAQQIPLKWTPVVKQMIATVVAHPLLPGDGLKLAEVAPHHQIAELEFYLRSGAIRLREMLQIIRPQEQVADSFDGFAEEGFLKGFIDLTFIHNGRYYILDYKTNHLGSTIEDYTKSNLKEATSEAMYDMQYHLYLVALHRFLGDRLKDYRYETHLGGAFYLFVRGMKSGRQEGILYDRPAPAIIHQLDHYIYQSL